MSPFFTIVIPTYNHAHFLLYALGSVVKQTFSNWECLVIDNHSSDDTKTVVSRFGDHRIRLLSVNNEGVIAKSRNLGMANSIGQWVAFLDSDDLWYETRLECIYNEICAQPDVDVVSTDELVVDLLTGSKSVLRYGPFEYDFYRIMLLEGNRLSTSATVLNLTFLSENGLAFREDERFITAEDYDLWLRLAFAQARFTFLRRIEGEYLIHGTNSSANIVRHFSSVRAVLGDHVHNIQTFDTNRQSLWYRISARVTLAEAKARLGSGDYSRGLVLVARSMLRHPLFIIANLWARQRRRRILKYDDARCASAESPLA
jgi:glycosyltransferase involved in cell wall biosynthesis